MSSLLEQAIIDAAALREAAIKNAESAILNKYSTNIKEAVDSLLEQEDEDLTADSPEGTESSSLEDSIPYGLTPDSVSEDQEIVLSMEELKDMAEMLSSAEEDLIGDATPHEDIVNDMDDSQAPVPQLAGEEEVPTVPISATLEEDLEIDIDDLDLDSLIEELVVDINPQKSGWAATPDSIMDYKGEMELARRSATRAKEQVDALKSAGERLSEQKESAEKKNTKLVRALQSFKENFEKVNLSNARLLYTNRILTNDSLNERQKNRIVEALSGADSIKEAKVIFETLKSAVGSVSGKALPQSLRETIERPTATLPRRKPRAESNPQSDRMQLLAGIRKSK
jgi:hypothetical protein